jgi:thymidylate synthase (FAD)
MTEWLGQRVEVLDKGWVELVDFMPHPSTGVSGDLAIVNAARVSFLGESKGEAADKKLLFYLLRNAHTSPFEMVEFKFRVRAPLVTWWQWVRHRTFHFQSVNAQSGRYTPFEEDDFYVPSVWRRQAKNNKQASEGEIDEGISEAFRDQLIAHYDEGYRLYKQALDTGVSKEMARLFLPGFSVYYTWVIKIDAHNLMGWLKLRLASDAQYEIRVYAEAIYEHFFKPALPWTAEAFEQYSLAGESPLKPDGSA